MKTLKTERLLLRPWHPEDAEDLFAVAGSPEVGPWAGWPPHKSVAESRHIIRDILMTEETYAIELQDTETVIGSISLLLPGQSNLPLQKGEGELGAWIGKDYWGQEYVVEAAREVLRHGFEDLGLVRVYGANFEGNTKSERLQEKLGFRYRRTIEDYPVPQLGETRDLQVRVLVDPKFEL